MLSGDISFTPFVGGKNDLYGACSLLEIGPFTILLDCGSSSRNAISLFNKLQNKLNNTGKQIDAVILSHADAQHVNSLPYICGKNGLCKATVISTLPVNKFGQLCLYDYCANKDMEGAEAIKGDPSLLNFDYDDIDQCFENATIVRYNQEVELYSAEPYGTETDSRAVLSLCAFPAGRTIGGSIWRLRYRATEVVYAVDVSLRGETVVAGLDLTQLPLVPSLLVTDAGSAAQLVALRSRDTGAGRRRKDKEDPFGLAAAALETLRGEGSVILPCETAGRTLELLHSLGSYWATHKLGMYPLVYLAPVGHSVLRGVRCQLEWMNEALCKEFYHGGPHPFELPFVQVCTSVREVERRWLGPTVVLCTDSSLGCGLAKELLLCWGGDPRCRIIFTDASDPASLAHQLRTQSPPVVASVTRPLRVALAGEELRLYRQAEERRRREAAEQRQQIRRESELQQLGLGEEEDGRTDPDTDSAIGEADKEAEAERAQHGTDAPALSRQASEDPSSSGQRKRRKQAHAALVARFLRPSFRMFQRRERVCTVDDFGADNSDLSFPAAGTGAASEKPVGNKTGGGPLSEKRPLDSLPVEEAIPTKVVSSSARVQFTCGLVELPAAAGRADTKTARLLVSRVAPARLLLLKGTTADCDSVMRGAKEGLTPVQFLWAPFSEETVRMTVPVERVCLQVPRALWPRRMQTVAGTELSGGGAMQCAVAPLSGPVVELTSGRDSRGLRTFRLLPSTGAAPAPRKRPRVKSQAVMKVEENKSKTEIEGMGEGKEEETKVVVPPKEIPAVPLSSVAAVDDFFNSLFGGAGDPFAPTGAAHAAAPVPPAAKPLFEDLDVFASAPESRYTAVAIGEVSLSSLKQSLEQKAVHVESKLSAAGAALVCDGQVLISKSVVMDNDFLLEGPPLKTFWTAREVLADKIAFVCLDNGEN